MVVAHSKGNGFIYKMALIADSKMSARRVSLHRDFEICKTRFYVTSFFCKHDYHAAFSHYTRYVVLQIAV